MLCSGMFNAGRTQAQVEAVELKGIYPQYDAIVPTLAAWVYPATRTVSVAFDDKLPPRRAVWQAGFGCTNMPIGSVAPPIASAYLGDADEALPTDAAPWPMGDADALASGTPPPTLVDAVGKAFDRATYGKDSETVGVLVIKDGRILAERYADGFGPHISNRTWSAGKSIAGTLAGIAVGQGLVQVDRPANIPEWGEAGADPRRAITLDHLLRMASGLHSDTAGNRTDAIYFGGTSVTGQATGWPIEALPGTRFRYANNDTLLAMRAIRAALSDDRRYEAFPRTQLFDRIGMTRSFAERDWQGNFIMSSQVWSTARDLGRLGLLWLNDGVWQGERILPEGWLGYMTRTSGPQPAQGPGYGATLWTFGPDQGLPAGTYSAQGNRGQYVMVLPEAGIVIVRRGEDPDPARFDIARFGADVLAAATAE